MSKTLLAGVVAAAALASIATPAAACPPGYVKGWIQGHRICHLPPGGNNKFQANVHPQQGRRGSLDVEAQKLKRRTSNFEIQNLMSDYNAHAPLAEKKNIRPAQRAFE